MRDEMELQIRYGAIKRIALFMLLLASAFFCLAYLAFMDTVGALLVG